MAASYMYITFCNNTSTPSSKILTVGDDSAYLALYIIRYYLGKNVCSRNLTMAPNSKSKVCQMLVFYSFFYTSSSV